MKKTTHEQINLDIQSYYLQSLAKDKSGSREKVRAIFNHIVHMQRATVGALKDTLFSSLG